MSLISNKKLAGSVLLALLISCVPLVYAQDADKSKDFFKSAQTEEQTDAPTAEGVRQLNGISDEQEDDLAKDSDTEINVRNAEIATLIRIFSKKTNRNYILDERVKGTVSIYLPGKISADEASYILDAVLALKGFTTVPLSDNLWKIIPAAEAKQSTVPIVDRDKSPQQASGQVVTRFINLKHVSAEDVKELISSLVSSYGLVSAYTGTNSLIIIDSENNIIRLMEIINRLDVPSTDSEVIIIPVEFANALDLVEKIKEILGEEGEDSAATAARNVPLANRNRRPAAVNAAVTDSGNSGGLTVSSRAKPPKIIADERTNSIILVADEETANRIKALVDQLDSKQDLSGNSFHVYRCQHASAEELAEVLSSLVGGGGSATSANSANSGSSFSRNRNGSNGGVGGTRGQTNQRNNSGFGGNSRNNRSGFASAGNSASNAGATTVSLSDDIQITADPATNSMIIIASKADYLRVLELLKDLDTKRRQVIVEALLLEVGIDDSVSLSSEFNTAGGGKDGGIFASNNFGNLATLISSPQNLQDFSFAAASSGSLSLPGITIPAQQILVRAAQNNSNVNVLSSPTILATDNEDAEIVVGQNVPFITNTASNQTDLNNVFNQVERQDVGITLRINPQISSSDFVTLRIFTEVSNVIPGTESSDLGPTTTIRTSETVAITKDSQMIVIGGLMSDNVTETQRGIPVFKDIPLLGSLFRTTIETQQRTNLLIFITPKIVKDQFDARDVSVKEKETFQEVIESYQIYPDRDNELENPAFDNVADGQIYQGEKPATIRPQAVPDGSDGIAPAAVGQSAPAASPLALDFSEQSPVGERGKHVIFEMAVSPPAGVWPGFIANSNDNLVAIRLPEEVGKFGRDFFKDGQNYLYSNGKSQIPLQAVSVFDSKSAAEQYYPALANRWYELSAYEIVNLNQKPWVRVN